MAQIHHLVNFWRKSLKVNAATDAWGYKKTKSALAVFYDNMTKLLL